MIKVLIDLYSIKPHPKDGQSKTIIVREGEATFEYKGKMNQKLLDSSGYNNRYIITKAEQVFRSAGGEYISVEGIVTDKSKIEQLKSFGVTDFTFNNDHLVFDHTPNPNYVFEYEKTKLKCLDCGCMVLHDEIESDYTDEGNEFNTCPLCESIDSFEDFKLEAINEALKRKVEL